MGSTRILQGNCIDTLKTLDACSVQTCVTSPPYYGLRDYGTARWIGGTDSECNHQYQKGGRNPETSSKQLTSAGTTFSQYEKVCKRCGALRVDDQIGLEETPEIYVARLVEVFREVWRVLADDGTLWLNLGDSYAGGASGLTRDGLPNDLTKERGNGRAAVGMTRKRPPVVGLKPKDLIGIPWMVAFALRSDGWYLRSDIIWHKPNPMPESVTDRPTKSHEYIFLLSKSAHYFYDYEAILEPLANASISRLMQDVENQTGSTRANGGAKTNGNMKAVVRNLHTGATGEPHSGYQNPDGSLRMQFNDGVPARNKRSVWTVTTKPYSGAHFATFPPDLIEPCILAGSRPGDWVLDPFGGSGTTLAVAIKHHRNGIACELNPAYIDLMNKRLSNVQPVLFAASVQP